MTTKHLLPVFIVLLIAFTPCAAEPVANNKPNIIYILADDLGYGELGCYGQTKIRTPHIDDLARRGMKFTRHYSGAPVCAPSRCVLLTGRYLSKAAVRNNREYKPEGQYPMPGTEITIAELLKEAGYATGAFGKWGLGYPGSESDPNNQGFDVFYGYNCQRVAHSFYPPHLWHNDKKITINKKPIPGHDRARKVKNYYGENYAPDLILKQALKFIRDKKDQPFFAYLPFIEPHLAMHPPHSWVEQYPKAWDVDSQKEKFSYLPHPRPRAGYAAMISDLDEHVGSVIQLLKELKLTDKTLIIFTSDNGPTHCAEVDCTFFDSTAGLRGLKGSVYEGGLRVPMIASWPGKIPVSTTTDHVSGFQDVMPTLCRIAGVPAPDQTDGVSFLPAMLADRENQKPQDVIAWDFHGDGGQYALIYQGRWKAIAQKTRQKGKPKDQSKITWSLYDLSKDPFEKMDFASTYPALLQRLIHIFNEQRKPQP